MKFIVRLACFTVGAIPPACVMAYVVQNYMEQPTHIMLFTVFMVTVMHLCGSFAEGFFGAMIKDINRIWRAYDIATPGRRKK